MHKECATMPNSERCVKCKKFSFGNVFDKSVTDVFDKSVAADPVVEAVRKDLLDRSNVGITKYGTTLAANNGNHRYWLNHAYEEALDLANYLKRAIMELDANGD